MVQLDTFFPPRQKKNVGGGFMCKSKRNILQRFLKINQIYLRIVIQGFFGVADDRFLFRFKKFKMAVEVYKN